MSDYRCPVCGWKGLVIILSDEEFPDPGDCKWECGPLVPTASPLEQIAEAAE